MICMADEDDIAKRPIYIIYMITSKKEINQFSITYRLLNILCFLYRN